MAGVDEKMPGSATMWVCRSAKRENDLVASTPAVKLRSVTRREVIERCRLQTNQRPQVKVIGLVPDFYLELILWTTYEKTDGG